MQTEKEKAEAKAGFHLKHITVITKDNVIVIGSEVSNGKVHFGK